MRLSSRATRRTSPGSDTKAESSFDAKPDSSAWCMIGKMKSLPGHTEHRHFEQRVSERAADHRIVGILEPVQPQLRIARELACRPAQDRAGDRPVGREAREQIEQDARVCGRGEGRDHRTGERVPQLGRRRTNTDGEREVVDVVEIAGGDRGDQRGDQLVERDVHRARAIRRPVRPRPRTPRRAAPAACAPASR